MCNIEVYGNCDIQQNSHNIEFRKPVGLIVVNHLLLSSLLKMTSLGLNAGEIESDSSGLVINQTGKRDQDRKSVV